MKAYFRKPPQKGDIVLVNTSEVKEICFIENVEFDTDKVNIIIRPATLKEKICFYFRELKMKVWR